MTEQVYKFSGLRILDTDGLHTFLMTMAPRSLRYYSVSVDNDGTASVTTKESQTSSSSSAVLKELVTNKYPNTPKELPLCAVDAQQSTVDEVTLTKNGNVISVNAHQPGLRRVGPSYPTQGHLGGAAMENNPTFDEPSRQHNLDLFLDSALSCAGMVMIYAKNTNLLLPKSGVLVATFCKAGLESLALSVVSSSKTLLLKTFTVTGTMTGVRVTTDVDISVTHTFFIGS